MQISEKAKEIYGKLANGWNTWDVRSVAVHVYLPEKIRLNITFVVPHMSAYCDHILWKNVESFGEHSVDGSYSEVNIRYLDGVYRIETSACDTELLVRVTPVKPRYNMYVLLEAGSVWGSKIDLAYTGEGISAKSKNCRFRIESLNALREPSYNPCTGMHIPCKADEAVYFRINSAKDRGEIDSRLETARHDWLNSTIGSDGILGEGLDAMRRSLLWNTIYDPVNKRVITPVSRDWCDPARAKNFPVNRHGHYLLFGWDTFFAALQLGLINRELAYSNVFAILEEMTPEGFVPNCGSSTGKTRDRSEPQVGSLCVWKLYQQFRDDWFIDECFEKLLEWNRWRFRERDFNGNGLLGLASVPWDASQDEEIWIQFIFRPKYRACLESGIDNSPMWDRAAYNEKKCCLELYYQGLCAEMVFDCELLEKMAALLGRETERAELSGRRLRLTALINSELWDESGQFYMNKHWNGEFDPCLSITGFYPITAGIVSEERLEPMLTKHLLNENEFWGNYVIPAVSRNDPGFADQQYWRGRIWAPTNFLVGEGIMRIGRYDIWDDMIRKGLDLFINCWRKLGAVGENYNAITGETAEPEKWSDRFYHWGALLVYMAVERIVNFNEWKDTLETCEVPEWLAPLRNIPVKNHVIDIG